MVINLHRVDERLWRSGQPLAHEWADLYAMGIRRVLKLNEATTGDTRAAEAAGLGVIVYELPDTETQSALRHSGRLDPVDQAIDAPGDGALLVHCAEGKDRTGIAIARYRVRRCGWTKQAAWDEWVAMGSHGYRGLVDAWNAWVPS